MYQPTHTLNAADILFHHCNTHSMWVVSSRALNTPGRLAGTALLLSESRMVCLLTGEFLWLSQAGDGFSDFVPWSMGCNYIFTIGSPSYNVQRMLTICSDTSITWPLPRLTRLPGYQVSRYLLISSSQLDPDPDLRPNPSTSERIFWQDPFLLWAGRGRNEWLDSVIVPARLLREDLGDGNQSQRGEGEDVSTIRGRHIIQKHPYEY